MEKYMPFIWIGFAVVMAISEAATTQLVSVWFVVGAVAAAVTTIFTPNIFIQLIVFLAFSAAALLITRPIVKRLKSKTNTVGTNADRLIGKTGVVISEIKSNLDVGQVKVMGQKWSAKSDYAPIAENTNVTVLAIEGVKLIVKPDNKEE